MIGTEDVEIRFVSGTGTIIVPLVTRFVDFRRMERGIEGSKVELLSLGSLKRLPLCREFPDSSSTPGGILDLFGDMRMTSAYTRLQVA